MIGKIVRALLGGLFLGGFVHILAILTIPAAAQRDAVGRVAAVAGLGRIVVIPADGSVLPDLDPAFVHAACGFDLGAGPIAVSGQMPADFWTYAVVSQDGIVASLERSATLGDQLDLVVGRLLDIERLRLAEAAAGTRTYAEAPSDLGFVLVRAFAGDVADRAALTATLSGLACEPVDMP